MSKHMKLRKLIGQNNHRHLKDGRSVTIIRIDKKVGMIPVAICKVSGALRGLEMTDPIILELLSQEVLDDPVS